MIVSVTLTFFHTEPPPVMDDDDEALETASMRNPATDPLSRGLPWVGLAAAVGMFLVAIVIALDH